MPCKSETIYLKNGLFSNIKPAKSTGNRPIFFISKKVSLPLARFLAFCLLPFAFSSCAPRLPTVLKENSGIVRAAADSLIFLNDSGNLPTIYMTNGHGRLLDSVFFEKEKNIDWEELARDPRDGRLFIGDFGNNGNARRDLHVLIFSPKTGETSRLDFAWPDQSEFPPDSFDDRNFDCEAMFFWKDSLHFFTKSHWRGRSFLCKHFVVPAQAGRQTPIFLEKTVLKKRVVSGAALSDDGQFLALVGYHFGKKWGFLPFSKSTIFTFQKDPNGRFFSKKAGRKRSPGWPLSRQYEAICFAGARKILLSNEHLKWQKPRIRTVRLRHLPPSKK